MGRQGGFFAALPPGARRKSDVRNTGTSDCYLLISRDDMTNVVRPGHRGATSGSSQPVFE